MGIANVREFAVRRERIKLFAHSRDLGNRRGNLNSENHLTRKISSRVSAFFFDFCKSNLVGKFNVFNDLSKTQKLAQFMS